MSPVILVAAECTDDEVGLYSGFKVVNKPLTEKINMRNKTKPTPAVNKLLPLILIINLSVFTDFINPPLLSKSTNLYVVARKDRTLKNEGGLPRGRRADGGKRLSYHQLIGLRPRAPRHRS